MGSINPSPPTSLNILIIGAGIAGLACGLTLRRAGHTCTIYERSSLSNEIGAAIHVGPNASRGLLALGFDPVRARFVKTKQTIRMDGRTLEVIEKHETEWVEGKFGAPWFLTHRVDYHEELKRLACGEEGKGKPVKVVLRSCVSEYVGSPFILEDRRLNRHRIRKTAQSPSQMVQP
jgi:salicylate hydroxylase